jgi:hypothetical protein
VAVSTSGALYELIRDRLRQEDRRYDQIGQAAVVLKEWADVARRLGDAQASGRTSVRQPPCL